MIANMDNESLGCEPDEASVLMEIESALFAHLVPEILVSMAAYRLPMPGRYGGRPSHLLEQVQPNYGRRFHGYRLPGQRASCHRPCLPPSIS